MNYYTEEEIQQGYFEDENEIIMCPTCREYTPVLKDTETEEPIGPACCG